MGLISSALGFQALSIEDPAQPLLPAGALYESLGLGQSDAGILVNSKMAERFSTVFACVKIISEDLSRVSLDIYQQMPDGGLRLAREHKNYTLLHDRPHPNYSSIEFRGAMIWSVVLHGNGYALIRRDNAARVVALIFLDPMKTSPVMKDGVLQYATTQTENGQGAFIDPSDILHFKVNSANGIIGRSPIQMCKNMVGLGLAAERFGAQLFGNGSRTTGIFTHPQRLDPESYDNLKKSLREAVTGVNALSPLVLEEGLTYQQLTINPQDAQMVDLRKFTKEETAQVFRVPLHKLQDLTRATNANLEYQSTDYSRNCLVPYATQIEAEIKYKILGLKTPFIVEHSFAELNRGDTATETAALISLRNAGVYSANQCLRSLRMNPLSEEDGGNLLLVNGAMIPLNSLTDYVAPSRIATQTSPDSGTTDPDQGDPVGHRRIQFVSSYRPLFRDAVGRSINRGNDEAFIRKALQPVIASMSAGLLAARCGQGELTDADLVAVAKIVDRIAVESKGWKKEDANQIANQITESVFDACSEGIVHE